MAEKKQDDLLEHTYSSYVRIRDVALNTCQKRWTIGINGKRGSGISVLAARHDDDDDDDDDIYFTCNPLIIFTMLLKFVIAKSDVDYVEVYHSQAIIFLPFLLIILVLKKH